MIADQGLKPDRFRMLERRHKSLLHPALARQFNVDRKTIRRDLCDLVQRGQLDRCICSDAEETE